MKSRLVGATPAIPAVLFLAVMLIVPLCLMLPYAFREHAGAGALGGFTLRHLTKVLADPYTYVVFWRSFSMAALVTCACILLGYPVAYAYSLAGRRTRQVILIAIIAPMLTSAVVRTYAWLIILGGREGVLNKALMALHWIDQPLRIINTPWAVFIGLTQLHLPLMAMPLIGALAGRDRRIEQASLNLGATHVQTFWRVTLPLSLPAIGAGSALVFSLSYTTFVPPQLLGGGNYVNAATTIYDLMINVLDWSKGGAYSLLLLLTCLMAVGMIALLLRSPGRWTAVRR